MTIAEFFIMRPHGPNCWNGDGAFRLLVRLRSINGNWKTLVLPSNILALYMILNTLNIYPCLKWTKKNMIANTLLIDFVLIEVLLTARYHNQLSTINWAKCLNYMKKYPVFSSVIWNWKVIYTYCTLILFFSLITFFFFLNEQ